MSDFWIMAGQLILALSILVVVHEWGHFAAARMFGIKVEKFFLFFDAWGIKLFQYKGKETTYGVGWLPLGGYVKIAGMIDESMDRKSMASPPKPYEFRSKKPWQKLIVMLGGIIMNVILGFLILTMHTFIYGDEYVPLDKLPNGIAAYSLGEEVGFKDGDKLVAVNGEAVTRIKEVLNNRLILEDDVVITVERNGERLGHSAT